VGRPFLIHQRCFSHTYSPDFRIVLGGYRMKIILVSRHPASVKWIAQKGLRADKVLSHLDDAVLQSLQLGDIVVGNLPIQLVAHINQLGARYYHFELNLPPNLRGAELTLEQLAQCHAKLTEYQAKKIKDIL